MSFINEFKSFAVKGNAVELAVGIIIGAAFGKIVTSLVEDIIMPPIGWIIGGVDFTALKLKLPVLVEGMQEVTINYGNFLQVAFNFMIVAFAVFMLVRSLNKLRAKEEAKPASAKPALSTQEKLLVEIRDALKKKK